MPFTKGKPMYQITKHNIHKAEVTGDTGKTQQENKQQDALIHFSQSITDHLEKINWDTDQNIFREAEVYNFLFKTFYNFLEFCKVIYSILSNIPSRAWDNTIVKHQFSAVTHMMSKDYKQPQASSEQGLRNYKRTFIFQNNLDLGIVELGR